MPRLCRDAPPGSLSWEEAAAVWMQYLTAYGALIDIAKSGKGDTDLIPAASSSVGLAAIQIANRVGAVPVALTRGKSKGQALLDAGAAHVIATDEQDLVKEVLGITAAKVPASCSTPSAARPSRSWRRRRPAGDFVPLRCVEHGADAAAPVRSAEQVADDSRLCPVGDHGRPERLERAKEFVNEGLAEGSLKPIVAKTFPLEQIVEAHRFLESNQQIGKIVVTV